MQGGYIKTATIFRVLVVLAFIVLQFVDIPHRSFFLGLLSLPAVIALLTAAWQAQRQNMSASAALFVSALAVAAMTIVEEFIGSPLLRALFAGIAVAAPILAFLLATRFGEDVPAMWGLFAKKNAPQPASIGQTTMLRPQGEDDPASEPIDSQKW